MNPLKGAGRSVVEFYRDGDVRDFEKMLKLARDLAEKGIARMSRRHDEVTGGCWPEMRAGAQ